MQGADRFSRARLVSLALGTRRYVGFFEGLFHAWPVESVAECVVRFQQAEMAEFVVCDPKQDFASVFGVWDEKPVVYEPEPVFFPDVGHPRGRVRDFLCEGVHQEKRAVLASDNYSSDNSNNCH